jgi:hypothetical protein
MRITRQQLNKLLEGIATAHYQIHTYGWGDVPDLLAREDIIYPFMMVTPQASVYGDNTIDHTYTISIADRVLKDKENEVAVDSDTHEILMHVVTQLDNLLYDDVDLIKGVSVTPFFDNFRHEVTGHFANVTVQVMYNYDACAVPSDNVPLPIPPPSDCADATYIVRFEDGTPIETGTIPSGGTKTIEVPNCPPSGTVEWELRDTDGVLIDSGSQNAGDPLTIVAPDGAVTITDSDGATLYVVNVTSGGTETQAIGDSSVEVRNSLNAVVDSGVVKAQGSGVFNAPDATFSINSVAVRTAPSNGSASIQVRRNSGSVQVGSLQGQHWRVGDSTVNVRKSDATLIQAVTVAAEDTESVNVADSVAVLKDTAANVISSTNIKATETEDIVAPDGSLQNSDASATLTVRSGEVNKPIADINIEVNTVVEGTIPALKDVKILITDGVNPVTPDDVSVVGDTVTVEVSAAPAPPPSGDFVVRFFDIDGTILKEQFVDAGNDATAPANPTFDPTYLVFAEWNQPFTNVQNDIDVGAIYDTIDGKTYLFVRITDTTGLQPTLALNKTGTALLTVDWGDSTTDTSTTNGDITLTKTAAYAAIGDYVITIESTDVYSVNTFGFLLGNNITYSHALLKLYSGINFRPTLFNGSFNSHFSLQIISINKENTSFAVNTFINARSLIHINLPAGSVSTGNDMFNSCYSLKNITYGADYIIRFRAFNSCFVLEKAVINDIQTGANSHFTNSGIKEVVYPDTVTSLFPNIFQNCRFLKKVKLNNTLTSVGNFAFADCPNIESLEFPDTLTSIGGGCFQNNISTLEYTFLSTTPPTLSFTSAFTGINAACKIYVPDASVAAYKAATNWVTYANYIYPLSTKP